MKINISNISLKCHFGALARQSHISNWSRYHIAQDSTKNEKGKHSRSDSNPYCLWEKLSTFHYTIDDLVIRTVISNYLIVTTALHVFMIR